MSGIDVVIAGSHPLSLKGLRSAVAHEADIRVLAECQDEDRLLDTMRNYTPDVLLVSAELLHNELNALEQLVTEVEETRVIVVSSREDAGLLAGALRCGAKGIYQREWPVNRFQWRLEK